MFLGVITIIGYIDYVLKICVIIVSIHNKIIRFYCEYCVKLSIIIVEKDKIEFLNGL